MTDIYDAQARASNIIANDGIVIVTPFVFLNRGVISI